MRYKGQSGASNFLGLDSTIGRGRGAISTLVNYLDVAKIQGRQINNIIQQDRIDTANSNINSINASVRKLLLLTNDSLSSKVNDLIYAYEANVEKAAKEAGGKHKLSDKKVANLLGSLYTQMNDAIDIYGGKNKNIVKSVANNIGNVSKSIRDKGLLSAGSDIRRFSYQARETEMSSDWVRAGGKVQNYISKILQNDRAGRINLSIPIAHELRDELKKIDRGFEGATTDKEREQALLDSRSRLQSVAERYARTSDDYEVMKGIDKHIERRAGAVRESAADKKSHLLGLKISNGMDRVAKGLGKTAAVFQSGFKIVDAGLTTFSKVNNLVNSYARQQTAVIGERSSYERKILGSGIKTRDLMAALQAGRMAGLDDATIINQQVGLQTQLARARWGEGPLIEAVGRWGGTPFNSNGSVKSQHEMMMEYSRIANSLGSELEQLQFLHDIGYSADQKEMIINYADIAARNERIKQNRNLQGTLERADTFEKQGYYSKVDAATKLEYRRREILNQNALEEGGWAYIKRRFSPDNWLFNDYTARRQGLESGKSDLAFGTLSKELSNLSAEVRKNGGAVRAGSFANAGYETDLTAKQLQALSISSGWATASEKNLGDNSPVKVLKKIIGKQQGGLDSSQQKALNRWSTGGLGMGIGTSLGMIGGAAIATIATGGLALPFLIGGAALGGLTGAAIGGATGHTFGEKTGLWGNWSNKDVEKAKKAAKGSIEEWEQWKRETGLSHIKRSTVLDVDFNKEALEGAQLSDIIAKATEMAGGKKVDINQVLGDKFFKFLVAGQTVGSKEYIEEFTKALARTGDADAYRGEAILKILSQGVDVKDNLVASRIKDLEQANTSEGQNATEAYKNAETQAKQEWKDAVNSTDVVNAQISEIRKEFSEGRLSQKTVSGLLGDVNLDKERERYLQEVKEKKIDQDKMPFAKWLETKWQPDSDAVELEAYKALHKKGLADKIDFDNLTSAMKSHKIDRSLNGKNLYGDVDALVAYLAMQNDTTEDDIKNNILTDKEYKKLLEKRTNDTPLSDKEQLKLRIYETSNKYKEQEKAKAKEEDEKAKSEAEEQKQKAERINDIATYTAAANLANNGKYSRLAEEAKQKYGLTDEQSREYDELLARSSRDNGGLEFSSVEDFKKYEDFQERENNMLKAKVDRKKLMRLVVASKGVEGLNSGVFTQEERDEFLKRKKEEKERFLAAGGSEGQYKLFESLTKKQLMGEKLTEKEQQFVKDSTAKTQKEIKKPTPRLHKPEEDLDAKFAAHVAWGNEAKAKMDKRAKGLTEAETSDMWEIDQAKKSGMSDEEIRRRYGNRIDMYNRLSRRNRLPRFNRSRLPPNGDVVEGYSTRKSSGRDNLGSSGSSNREVVEGFEGQNARLGGGYVQYSITGGYDSSQTKNLRHRPIRAKRPPVHYGRFKTSDEAELARMIAAGMYQTAEGKKDIDALEKKIAAKKKAGGTEGASAESLTEITKSAAKGTPSVLTPAAENVAKAEKAAGSGAAAKTQQKAGMAEETGKTTSIDEVRVVQTFEFGHQQGTPENIGKAAYDGASKAIAATVRQASSGNVA